MSSTTGRTVCATAIVKCDTFWVMRFNEETLLEYQLKNTKKKVIHVSPWCLFQYFHTFQKGN